MLDEVKGKVEDSQIGAKTYFSERIQQLQNSTIAQIPMDNVFIIFLTSILQTATCNKDTKNSMQGNVWFSFNSC
jgi:hypothetical protein